MRGPGRTPAPGGNVLPSGGIVPGERRVHPLHRNLRDVVGAVLVALMLGACATGAPATSTDRAAKEEYNKQKQQDLERMIDEGMEMR